MRFTSDITFPLETPMDPTGLRPEQSPQCYKALSDLAPPSSLTPQLTREGTCVKQLFYLWLPGQHPEHHLRTG